MKPKNKAERQEFFSEKNKRRALVTSRADRKANREMGRALAARTWNPKKGDSDGE